MDRKKKNIVELTLMSTQQYMEMEKLPLSVLTDNVRSLYNIGSLFRVADVFGINQLFLTGISGCPPHPEISKTALGAEESVKWTYLPDAFDAALSLKKEGWKICVLEQTHGSIPLEDFSPLKDEKYLLIAGNEVNGVDQRIVDIADIVLEIPQYGTKHSLNVSASGAIAIYVMSNKIRNYK